MEPTETATVPIPALDRAVMEAIMLDAARPRFVIVFENKCSVSAETRDGFNKMGVEAMRNGLRIVASYYGIPLQPTISFDDAFPKGEDGKRELPDDEIARRMRAWAGER